LSIAGNGLNPVNRLEVFLFLPGQFFERQQRRRLEREHREGAAQDIGQLIAAVGAPMIRQLLKFFTQGLHQVIEGDFLL
jgi:hypothetical protein